MAFHAMVATTRTAEKRRVVAGCFQELLFLTTHGLIELDQKRPYGNILIAKTELFGEAAAAVTAAPTSAGKPASKPKGPKRKTSA